MSHRRFLVVPVFALSLCAGGAAFAAGADDAQAMREDGRMLAERQCSSCHAIGKTGDSPRADAPRFRTILSRYRSDALETDLVEGIKLGHPDMPQFRLNARAVDGLILYLKSIQVQGRAENPGPPPGEN